MRGRHTRRERRREILHLALSTVPIHTHTHIPPLVLMAFSCLVTSLEIPLFQHHLTTYHRHLTPTPSQQQQQQHFIITHPPPPLLYHKTPPVFLALRTEPNQNVLFCCLGGGSVWCVAHGVFRTVSSSVHFPRRGLVHILFFFLLSLWGCGDCVFAWMDGRTVGWMGRWMGEHWGYFAWHWDRCLYSNLWMDGWRTWCWAGFW